MPCVVYGWCLEKLLEIIFILNVVVRYRPCLKIYDRAILYIFYFLLLSRIAYSTLKDRNTTPRPVVLQMSLRDNHSTSIQLPACLPLVYKKSYWSNKDTRLTPKINKLETVYHLSSLQFFLVFALCKFLSFKTTS